MINEKLYRDPVHDLIALDKNSRDDVTLMELIDTPEVQRLRRIRQMGLAYLTYQGAEHSRFNHSLGAMWTATRILDQLNKDQPIPPEMQFATRCAALLHDVGHGPLSHVFESFMAVSHEDWTRRVILDERTGVNRVLRQHHASLPGEVASIIEGHSKPRFLSQIIASQLDADRFDYLLRDSQMTGVKYGIYDFERLLHVLRLDSVGDNIIVAGNGIQAVEKYLQARYHMYSQVYLHKTVRAGERVFGNLLRRASHLTDMQEVLRLWEDDPLVVLLRDKADTDLLTFLEIDDATIQSALKRWAGSDDPILADLSRRIVGRKLFKTLDVSKVDHLEERCEEAREVVRSAGYDPEYYFIVDTSGDVPYKPYDARKPGGSSHITIERGGRRKDIHEVSEVVAGLVRAAFTVKRAIFPARGNGLDLRQEMSRIFLSDDTRDDFLGGY